MKVNVLTGVLSVATIGFAVASGYFHHQLGVAHDQLATETQLRLDAEAAAQKAQQARGALEKDWERFVDLPADARAALSASLRTSGAGSGSATTNDTAHLKLASAKISANGAVANGPSLEKKVEAAKAPEANGIVDITGELLKSADGAAALRNMQKNSVQNMYGGLLKDLQLSPEAADKFIDLIAESQFKATEVTRMDSGQTAIKTRITNESRKETEQNLLGLLGQDKYSQYQDYQRNLGEHMSINQLRSQLATMSRQLPTQVQEKSLYAAMIEEKSLTPRPTMQSARSTEEFRELNTQWTDDYERRVLDRAERILTPEQFTTFRDRQEQQARMRRAIPPVAPSTGAPMIVTK